MKAKGSVFQDMYRRLVPRLGHLKAIWESLINCAASFGRFCTMASNMRNAAVNPMPKPSIAESVSCSVNFAPLVTLYSHQLNCPLMPHKIFSTVPGDEGARKP